MVSLFSCGGIGDYGFLRAGFKPVLISDVDERRLLFAKNLLPDVELMIGDINEIKGKLTEAISTLTADNDFALSLTPPCQGMSKNGIKTILKAMRTGGRSEIDPRNYLILPCLEIIKDTKPKIVFFENVPEAKSTLLLIGRKSISFMDYFVGVMNELGYVDEVKEINFRDYGVPQNRKRVLAVFTLDSFNPNGILNKIEGNPKTLREAISGLPVLDAKQKDTASSPNFHALHKVPIMRPQLYEWVKKTPEGQSALENNECSKCLFRNKNDDLYCESCNSLLDKPFVIRGGSKRLIKGYNSSYRRQRWDRPANTVTTRSAFASSAYNLHPSENRVLSLYECAILQGLNPKKINWVESVTNKIYPDYFLRDIIGEAIPAGFTELIGKRVLENLCVEDSKVHELEAVLV